MPKREHSPSVSDKSRKYAGAAKYKCSYKKEWETEYPIQQVTGDQYKFRCIPCQRIISCDHQGKKDVSIHCDTDTHKRSIVNLRTQTTLKFTRVGQTTSTQRSAHRAEAKTVEFIVQHNLSISTADHLIPLYKHMFPDSAIAKSMNCARTKSTQILNRALQPECKTLLVEHMRTHPFSLSTDGSNDDGLEKMNPAIITIFDVNRSHTVDIKFYDMCMTTGEHAGMAKTIFAAINDKLEKDNIPWTNCVAVGVDNTNTNIGSRNSIKSRVLSYNPATYFNGCPCHLAHIAASKGNDAYVRTTGFNAEDLAIDLYYWFEKSTKRKGVLNDFYGFCDMEYSNLIRHVSVRWLSLEAAVYRCLQKHEGLKSYFLSADHSEARFRRLKAIYETDPQAEIHLLVISSILPIFTHFNLQMQREDPCIHLLYPAIKSLCKRIAQRIVKPEVLVSTSPLNIELADCNTYLSTDDIFIGAVAKNKLKAALDNGDMTERQVDNVRSGVLEYLKASLSYIYRKFPVNEPVITNAVWVDITNRLTAKFYQVEYFCEQFSVLLGDMDRARLHEEFVDYQTLSDDEIGTTAFREATTRESDADCAAQYRMDVLWWYIGELKEPGTRTPRFAKLSQIARLVLIIPHSNAGPERVFSLVRVNRNDQRNRLNYDGTLTSALTVKMDRPDRNDNPCYKYEPTAALLDRVPKVTREYNIEQSSQSCDK